MDRERMERLDAAALGRAAKDLGVRMVGNCPNALSWEEAVERGMSPEVIGQLITHQERIDANRARKAFVEARAAAKAKLSLESIMADFSKPAWVGVHDRVRAREMPPPASAQPRAEERESFLEWLGKELTAAAKARQATPATMGEE